MIQIEIFARSERYWNRRGYIYLWEVSYRYRTKQHLCTKRGKRNK